MVTKNCTVLKQAFFKIASNIYNSIAYVLIELRKLTIQRVRENRVGGDEKNTVHIGAYLDTKFHSYFRRRSSIPPPPHLL